MSVAAWRAAPRGSQLRAALVGLPLEPFGIALLTLAVLGLRLSQVHQSLFGDELWTYQQIHGHSFGSMFRAIHPGAENAPPLFFVLAWLTSKLGDPTVWIRLPSVVLGTATVPLVYALGRQTVGGVGAPAGAAVFALSPFAAFYGIEARPYASMAFFAVLSTLALVKALRTSSARWWVVYVLAATAAAYTHYTVVFVLAVQAVWATWAARDRVRIPLAANAAIVLLYLPWIPHLKSRELAIIGALEPLDLHNIGHDLVQATVGYPLAPLHAIPSIPGLVAIGICVAGAILALALRRRAQAPARGGQAAGHSLITALALATPVGVLLYSLVSTDIWDARDLYASLPAAALVLGALLAAIPRSFRALALLAVLGTLLAGTIRAVTPRYARPQYRAAARYLDHVAKPGDPVIVYPSYLNLNDVIAVQFHRRHRVLKGVPSRWPAPPSGGATYLILSRSFDAAVRLATPQPPGYALVGRRQYYGSVPFTVLTYRRLAAVASG